MPEERRISFKAWRIAILLSVLGLIIGWGWNRERQREQRRSWESPVRLGVVVVERSRVAPELVSTLAALKPSTEAWIRGQSERYRNTLVNPVLVDVVGPVPAPGPIPSLPLEPTFGDTVKFTWELWRWTSKVDAGLPDGTDYDSTMYLVVSAQVATRDRLFFEGLAEQGGDVGLVEIDLAEETVFAAMYTAVHEFLHTLGATDKYTYDGHSILPSGLAEPAKEPLYPQSKAEIMGRNIAVSQTEFKQPTNWSQVVVGSETAREIGWSTAADAYAPATTP